jgi:hypothetical protein
MKKHEKVEGYKKMGVSFRMEMHLFFYRSHLWCLFLEQYHYYKQVNPADFSEVPTGAI